jgi:plastocyanin
MPWLVFERDPSRLEEAWMRGVRLHVLVGLAALSVVAAACGSDANDASSGGGGSTGSSSTGSTGSSGASMGGGNLYGGGGGGRYGSSGEMTGATGSDAGGAKADVSASVNNYLFMPKTVKVKSGDTLEVTNGNAKTPHTFTVVGEDVDLELAPLTSETTTIDLAPGTYQLICRFHEQLGMKGILKVA